MPYPQIDEAFCLQKIAKGDPMAFDAVYMKYRLWAFERALHYTRCSFAAEDILQEVFSKIWIGRERIAMMDNFKGYISMMIKNHCLNYLKEVKRRSKNKSIYRALHDNGFMEIEEKLLAKEYHVYYLEAIERLTKRQKLVYFMIDDGKRYKQVSRQLKITMNTVTVHRAKALHIIRDYVKNRMEPEEGGINDLLRA